ncbi:DUF6924 domain-containing protein [Streptomyces sp. NBC_00467]|uniref:DUF6924 domain-containing protein n=1 Tax=Streptomyces sp. NBC_00467 TaxID=2975752 RepID=UPI002E16E902
MIVWLDSPLAGAIGARMLAGTELPSRVGTQLWGQARAQIEAQLRVWGVAGTEAGGHVRARIRDQVGQQVRSQVWSQTLARLQNQAREQVRNQSDPFDEYQVWAQIYDRVHSQGVRLEVRDAVRAQVRDQIGAELERSVAGQHDLEILAMYDYLRTHWSVTEGDRLAGVMRVAQSAGRWWPFENAVILTERPTVLRRDDQGRLHCDSGPAVAYADGFAVWAWHGVRLPQRPVKTRPTIDRTSHHFEAEALVVRTDYSDDAAWRAVVDLLHQPDEGGFEVRAHIVDDPAFAGAGPDEVMLCAVASDPMLEAVFLADATTMREERSLLAVSTRFEALDDEDEGDIVSEELGRQFRLLPQCVHLMHVNLAIGRSDFWEFAYEAACTPDKTLRL